jgi:hypothetical protein
VEYPLLALVLIALFACRYIVPGIWMYLDAERRGASGVAWLIAWFVGNVFALLIWYLVRPRDPRMDGGSRTAERLNASE